MPHRTVEPGAPLQPITVLNILNELRPSGAETMLRAASREWALHGVDSHILALAPRAGSFADELRSAGYPVETLWASTTVTLVKAFRAQLLARPVDVVHLHAERGNFWLALAARSAGCAVVRTVHNVFAFSGFLRLKRASQRIILRRCGVKTVAVGVSVQRNENERFLNRTQVIANWFDPVRFTRRTEQDRLDARRALLGDRGGAELLLVTVGNCSTAKNHHLLAAALAEMEGAPPWVWLHLGRGDSEDEERALVGRLGIAENVRFLGDQASSSLALAAADVFVMTSRFEGMSIAAVEAMARGVPVILTDVPGLRDLAMECDAVMLVAEEASAIGAAVECVARQTRLAREATGDALADSARSFYSMASGVALYSNLYRAALRRSALASGSMRRIRAKANG